MKNILLLLFISIAVMGCQTESTTGEPSTIAPVTMSDGEVVSYRFSYSDESKPTAIHTIVKTKDAKPSGKITYSINNENNTIMQLGKLDNVNLTDEQSFLLYDSKLLQTGGVVNAILILEEQISLTVESGTFPVYKNIYTINDANKTYYNHIDNIKPLKGLVKYVWSEGNTTITVELIEWNSL